jgi:hypothetical protein
MARSGVTVCVLVLLSAAGCSSSIWLLNLGGLGGRRQVTDGSVNAVTAVLQARLADAGIAVVTEHKSDQVRLVGIAPSRKAFRLVIQPDPATSGKKTVVCFEEDAGDEALWQLVRAALERPAQSESSTSHTPRS